MMASAIKVGFLVKDVVDPEEEARQILAAAAAAHKKRGVWGSSRRGGSPVREKTGDAAVPEKEDPRGQSDDLKQASSIGPIEKVKNLRISSDKFDRHPHPPRSDRAPGKASDKSQIKAVTHACNGSDLLYSENRDSVDQRNKPFSGQLTRPMTAPKRRPNPLVPPRDEKPAWRSRGSVDRDKLMIDQYNEIWRARTHEWGSIRARPSSSDAFLGADFGEARKSIRSSHSRERPANTCGANLNIKPYKFPEHFCPPQIRRGEEPPPPEVGDRPNWSYQTTLYDTYDRARPIANTSKSTEYMHASFRSSEISSMSKSKGFVNVTKPLDDIRSECSNF